MSDNNLFYFTDEHAAVIKQITKNLESYSKLIVPISENVSLFSKAIAPLNENVSLIRKTIDESTLPLLTISQSMKMPTTAVGMAQALGGLKQSNSAASFLSLSETDLKLLSENIQANIIELSKYANDLTFGIAPTTYILKTYQDAIQNISLILSQSYYSISQMEQEIMKNAEDYEENDEIEEIEPFDPIKFEQYYNLAKFEEDIVKFNDCICFLYLYACNTIDYSFKEKIYGLVIEKICEAIAEGIVMIGSSLILIVIYFCIRDLQVVRDFINLKKSIEKDLKD